jgi:HEAT repeat protein
MFSNIEEMKNKGNVEWLSAFLYDYKDDSEKGWMARLDAAEALAQLGDPRGFDYLREMAKSPNKDTQEIALEILDGLKDYPIKPIAQTQDPVQPKSESLFFKINSQYPYGIAWAAFVVLYLIAVQILNVFATNFLVLTQTWLPAWISSLFLYLLLLVAGFFAFRFVIKIFVLPYEDKS